MRTWPRAQASRPTSWPLRLRRASSVPPSSRRLLRRRFRGRGLLRRSLLVPLPSSLLPSRAASSAPPSCVPSLLGWRPSSSPPSRQPAPSRRPLSSVAVAFAFALVAALRLAGAASVRSTPSRFRQPGMRQVDAAPRRVSTRPWTTNVCSSRRSTSRASRGAGFPRSLQRHVAPYSVGQPRTRRATRRTPQTLSTGEPTGWCATNSTNASERVERFVALRFWSTDAAGFAGARRRLRLVSDLRRPGGGDFGTGDGADAAGDGDRRAPLRRRRT